MILVFAIGRCAVGWYCLRTIANVSLFECIALRRARAVQVSSRRLHPNTIWCRCGRAVFWALFHLWKCIYGWGWCGVVVLWVWVYSGGNFNANGIYLCIYILLGLRVANRTARQRVRRANTLKLFIHYILPGACCAHNLYEFLL